MRQNVRIAWYFLVLALLVGVWFAHGRADEKKTEPEGGFPAVAWIEAQENADVNKIEVKLEQKEAAEQQLSDPGNPDKGTLKERFAGAVLVGDSVATGFLDYEILDDHVFKTVSDTQTPQGVLCIVRQQESSLDAFLKAEKPLLLLLENLQDPGNLGTILRTAEGAGVTGVILSKGCVDLYNSKTIRSTMGSVYRVPTLYTEDLCQTVEVLKKHGICSYAAHLKGANFYDQENYQSGTAFLIGNEGNGLTEELTEKADTLIRIPMEGQLESLNAGVASAILMYEAYRQRR